MSHKLFAILGAFFFVLTTSSVLSIRPVQAQTTITVDTFADLVDTNLDCSLREAIIAADTNTAVDGCAAGSGDDVILLATGSYTLTLAGLGEQATLSGDLDISAPEGLTIQGAGVVSTTIDAGDIDRAFEIINPLSRVIIRDLTIQNGRSPTGQGSGAIKNVGRLTLANILIQGNRVEGSSSDDVGGAICNGCGLGEGHLTIVDSTIRDNTADRAGGIFSNGMLTITNSSIVSNSARAGGGLINFATENKRVTLNNTTISGNVAENNSGGIGQFGDSLVISNSTIANNSAQLGAGINYGNGDTFLHNTMIAHNLLGENCFTLGTGAIISTGYNLSSDGSCSLSNEGDLDDTDPLLLALDNYGGPTPTHKLSFRSPAINAGTDRQCPSFDQRGVSRPQGDGCDIGAFEYDTSPQLLHLPVARKSAP